VEQQTERGLAAQVLAERELSSRITPSILSDSIKAISKSTAMQILKIDESASIMADKIDESTAAHVLEIQAGIKKLVASIESATRGQNKRLEQSTKAQAKSLQGAIESLTQAIGAIPKGDIENKVIVEQSEQKPVQFHIHRDNNGYMKTVIARPVQEIVVAPVSGIEYT